MHTFDSNACPIKLNHIDLSGDYYGSMELAFMDPSCGRAAFLVLSMMKDEGTPAFPAGEFRGFTLHQFEEFCCDKRLMPFEYNPSHKKGVDRLIRDGYIIPVSDSGYYVLSLELVARCFGHSPAPSIVTGEVEACSA